MYPQANDDTDFKNQPPQKKLKLTLGKGKEKVTVECRFSTCSASELETAWVILGGWLTGLYAENYRAKYPVGVMHVRRLEKADKSK